MKKVLKLTLTSIVALALILVVLVGLSLLFGIFGVTLSAWPILFCFLYFTTFAQTDASRLLPIILGGVLGMLAGTINSVVVGLTSNATAGLVCMLVYVVIILAYGLSVPKKVDMAMMFVFATLTTGITGLCTFGTIAGDWLGFLCGAIIIVITGAVTSAQKKKEDAKAAAEKPSKVDGLSGKPGRFNETV